MELQQLGNLIDLFLPDAAREPVKVMDADGNLWPVMSIGWSAADQCHVICFDDGEDS